MIRKNLFSIIVALIILYLSLANSRTFDSVPVFNIPYMDKIVHFGMYFALMSAIIFENRRSVMKNEKLLIASVVSLSYGILMEFLQAYLTSTRSGNFYDALADLAGVVVSVIIWMYIRSRYREKLI
jgi:VanZ family protein